VKRSGRNKPMKVAIHKFMEPMLGISLYSCLYLKLAKTLCHCYYLLCFLFNKIRRRGADRFCLEADVGGLGGRWPKQYKYKNDKIKK
jgi:hypothetical protein